MTTLTPYRPTPPSRTSPPSPPSVPAPTTVTPITAHRIKTATGGTKRVARKPPPPPPTFVCDGVDCSFSTNSPYKFFTHQSTPHIWKSGSQNWCFAKAKALAQGNTLVGLRASGPTNFPSMDIRVKKGLLPPNVVVDQTPLSTPAIPPTPTVPTTPSTTDATPTTPTPTNSNKLKL